MTQFEASVSINAAPDVVWEVITNGAQYEEWDSGIANIVGDIADGQTIKIFPTNDNANDDGRDVNEEAEDDGNEHAFSVDITLDADRRHMTWTGREALGMCKSIRTFTITPTDTNTELLLREEFTGVFSGIVAGKAQDLNAVFRHYANGACRRAQQLTERNSRGPTSGT